jgi:hypothetical protein
MYATINSIHFPALPKEVQKFCFKSYIYGRACTKAFNVTIVPRLIKAGKSCFRYSYLGLQTLEQQQLDSFQLRYNPVRAAIKAARDELHSPEAIACYRQIRSVAQVRFAEAKERLVDIAIIGLCGVIAIADGIVLAKRCYQSAKSLYARVEGFFNPPAPSPVELPSVNLAMATKSDAEIVAIFERLRQERQIIAHFDAAEASVLEQVQSKIDNAIVQVNIQKIKDARAALVLAQECDRSAQAQREYVVGKAVEFVQAKDNPSPNGEKVERRPQRHTSATPSTRRKATKKS